MEIQIITGFLGAGKTTFLNKYLPLLTGKTAVIENEFGDMGIDADLIRKGVQVKEIYAGCICCNLAGDFMECIREIKDTYSPDCIVIEPSGVGRLSDVIKACEMVRGGGDKDIQVTRLICIVDVTAFDDYYGEFGSFYADQIQYAKLLLLSHVDKISSEEKLSLVNRLKELNPSAAVYDGDWRVMKGRQLLTLIKTIEAYDLAAHKISRPSIPADKVFSSISIVIEKIMAEEEIQEKLKELGKKTYGHVLRAKGILRGAKGKDMVIDYTPYKVECRDIDNSHKRGIVIIGCGLDKLAIEKLFQG